MRFSSEEMRPHSTQTEPPFRAKQTPPWPSVDGPREAHQQLHREQGKTKGHWSKSPLAQSESCHEEQRVVEGVEEGQHYM
jgi:hypothetical protein